MTTAARQARWRANDAKALVQVRLTHEAVERLDQLVQRNGWTGRAEAIERLLTADAGPAPEWIAHEAIRLARAFFQATGRSSVSVRREHATYTIARYMER
jgi:hypothetical protein